MKIVYLEMFGYDMSWASFHVLEVMSSSRYLQKRAGYLGAVQSFRPDTDVLMLATNLLKKVFKVPNSVLWNFSSDTGVGSHIIKYSEPVLTTDHITAHYHSFACDVIASWRSISAFSLARGCAQEGSCVPLQTCIDLSRGAQVCMAETKGATHGRWRGR